MYTEKILRPDSKGRICLGRLAEGVSSFHLTVDEEHRIMLVPYSEIPSREKWLFESPEALASVKRGLQDSEADQLRSRGSFSDFSDEGDD